MLYDVTYEVVTEIMEIIDGYSGYSEDKHDIVNMVTGERLKENPFILSYLQDGRNALMLRLCGWAE